MDHSFLLSFHKRNCRICDHTEFFVLCKLFDGFKKAVFWKTAFFYGAGNRTRTCTLLAVEPKGDVTFERLFPGYKERLYFRTWISVFSMKSIWISGFTQSMTEL